MPSPSGNYDEEARELLAKTRAYTAIAIVFDGLNGHGFSVASMDPDVHQKIPGILRQMAELIDKQNQERVEITRKTVQPVPPGVAKPDV